MANLLVDKRDQLFVLNDMLKIDELNAYDLFRHHTSINTAGINMILDEAHRFAEKDLVQTTLDGDAEGCSYDPGTHSVKLPESYHQPYADLRKGKWFTMSDAESVGGDGYPLTLGAAVSEVFYAGGFYLYGGVEITHAAAKVLELFGSAQQKEVYMKRLYDLEWTATMCLTEPDAGSDVGNITTQATPLEDGTYSIKGTKIFITFGDHDLTDNIIHMVLARIKDDPPGTKGLSLFIIPKYRVNEKGETVDRNGVYCTGIEHKMGLNGLVTCTLSFGDKELCTGHLLGKQGHGIAEMFHMMNEQRLLVGLEGLSFSSCAFLSAKDYAQQRKQGYAVASKGHGQQAAIIEHADIKRMLLTMKSYVEGCRAMTYYAGFCLDNAHGISHDNARGTAEKKDVDWQSLVDLLIPVVKAYNTGMAWEITGMAIQCAGGYGYCKDYPFERLARDCKVTSIFEGTNGIQSIDLVFRKILKNKGKAFDLLLSRIRITIEDSAQIPALKTYAENLETALNALSHVVDHFFDLSEAHQTFHIQTRTLPFLECFGDIILGWMHLWQMDICCKKLIEYTSDLSDAGIEAVADKKKQAAFYSGKILSARFYINTLLPQTIGKLKGLTVEATPVLNISKRLL